jgi:Leucine-rich repeat (LRR) protein
MSKHNLITEQEAIDRFQLSTYIGARFGKAGRYLLYEGNVEMEGSVNLQELCSNAKANGVIVAGNLTITGVLYQPDINDGEPLFVTGNLHAKSVNKGGAEFYVKGNLVVEQTIYGYYNHGSLVVEGDTEAVTIFAEDHYFRFCGDVQGLVINTGEIVGVEADYNTTEPLLDELIKNDHYSDTGKLDQYINEGRNIINTEYIAALKRNWSYDPEKNTSAAPQLISLPEVKYRFDLSKYEPFNEFRFDKIIFFDGHAFIDGDLNQQWAEKTVTELGADPDLDSALILVNGNLTVAGTISPSDECFPFLLVLGNVQCDVLQSYDECIYITGDADITYAFDGNYNDGSIVIEGKTRVPYILNSDHSSTLDPQGAILINYYGDADDFFEYDYTLKDFERVIIPPALDQNGSILPDVFIKLLKAGKSPLKKGARPARLIVAEELQQLSNGNTEIVELDLSGKKLKEFPVTLTKLTSLKKLILNDNSIESIPAGIKELVNLEELEMERCGLKNLPAEIGLLPNLKLLNVANNNGLVLPESINNLTSLQVLNISYNAGFGLPATLEGLKSLEELKCYQCSTAAPIEFPVAITHLSGLKRLFMGSNSIVTIPDSILELQNLEELDLNSSLCYLNSIPDLSQLKNLKTLHANGLISYTTRPTPKQNLLKSFFQLTGLEALYLDRHGERKEKFIKMNEFEEMEKNLAHDPERLAELAAKLTRAPNIVYGDGKKGTLREALKPEHLEGISQLQNLKMLDLSFNGLTSLPEEVFALKGLQFLDLQYNALSTSERLKISKNLPGCTIDFRDNRTDDTADSEDVKQWHAMNTLMKEANALMGAKSDKEKLVQSLKKYDEVLAFFSSGKVVDQYNLLYAHYGKAYAYFHLTANHKDSISVEEMLALDQAAIQHGLRTLELVPVMIWHFTELGKFHEEVCRFASNTVAWKMHLLTSDKAELEKALAIVQKGVDYIEREAHYYIYDTQVRILLKLERKEEAYQIVKRILALSPDFGDFQDIKQGTDYNNWLARK